MPCRRRLVRLLAFRLLRGDGARCASPRRGASRRPRAAPPTRCVTCHATLHGSAAGDAGGAVLAARTSTARTGFACVDCHGGDPAAGDKARAHDAGAAGFKGKPAGPGA